MGPFGAKQLQCQLKKNNHALTTIYNALDKGKQLLFGFENAQFSKYFSLIQYIRKQQPSLQLEHE